MKFFVAVIFVAIATFASANPAPEADPAVILNSGLGSVPLTYPWLGHFGGHYGYLGYPSSVIPGVVPSPLVKSNYIYPYHGLGHVGPVVV